MRGDLLSRLVLGRARCEEHAQGHAHAIYLERLFSDHLPFKPNNTLACGQYFRAAFETTNPGSILNSG
jgi:hypothetical protein